MSTTPLWLAPDGLVKKLESGTELGDVMDEVTNSEVDYEGTTRSIVIIVAFVFAIFALWALYFRKRFAHRILNQEADRKQLNSSLR